MLRISCVTLGSDNASTHLPTKRSCLCGTFEIQTISRNRVLDHNISKAQVQTGQEPKNGISLQAA